MLFDSTSLNQPALTSIYPFSVDELLDKKDLKIESSTEVIDITCSQKQHKGIVKLLVLRLQSPRKEYGTSTSLWCGCKIVDYMKQILFMWYMLSHKQNIGKTTWRINFKYHPLIYTDLPTWLTEFQHTCANTGTNLLWNGTVLGNFYFVCNFWFEIWKQILKGAVNEPFINFSCQSFQSFYWTSMIHCYEKLVMLSNPKCFSWLEQCSVLSLKWEKKSPTILCSHYLNYSKLFWLQQFPEQLSSLNIVY